MKGFPRYVFCFVLHVRILDSNFLRDSDDKNATHKFHIKMLTIPQYNFRWRIKYIYFCVVFFNLFQDHEMKISLFHRFHCRLLASPEPPTQTMSVIVVLIIKIFG
jgi:hypothetical protein